MASATMIVQLDAQEFLRELDKAFDSVERLRHEKDTLRVPTREVVAGAALALCASPRKFSRRNLFGLK